MIARVSVRDVKCLPAWAGSTLWDVASSQIPSLRRLSVPGPSDLIEPPPGPPFNSKCTCKSKFKCNFHFKQIAYEIVNAHATGHEHENANAHINKKS